MLFRKIGFDQINEDCRQMGEDRRSLYIVILVGLGNIRKRFTSAVPTKKRRRFNEVKLIKSHVVHAREVSTSLHSGLRGRNGSTDGLG